jgi:cytochrome c5
VRYYTFLLLMCFSLIGLADDRVDQLFSQSCGACHNMGIANAPKTGDVATWGALIKAKGMPSLVSSVKTGLNAMPPKGMCDDCNDADYEALIKKMAVISP